MSAAIGFRQAESPRMPAGNGIRTANRALTLLKSILNYAVLHEHLARNPAKGVKALPTPTNLVRKREHELVFPNSSGNAESPPNLINRALHPALRRAGLPRILFHDLRHCYASRLLNAGQPLWVVSRLLGHSSIKITADTYGHLMPDIVEGVGQRLGDRVFQNAEGDGHFLDTSADSTTSENDDKADLL